MNFVQKYYQIFRQANAYSLYILFIMLVVYMLNQLDRYALSITSVETAQSLQYGDKSCLPLPGFPKNISNLCKNKTKATCEQIVVNGTNGTIEHVCKYDFNGQGIEYQILAGPAFILIFTFTGILISLFADKFQNRRVLILTVSIIWWSVMTILSGVTNSYWQLLLLRFGLGIGQAGCNPLATGLISDYFSLELRGAALGIYNWGIYTGYSMAFAIGNQILKHLDWRWVYILCGIPGLLVGPLVFLSVKEPKKEIKYEEPEPSSSLQIEEESSTKKLVNAAREFLKPTLLLLCLAGSIRNAAGYVWGYNNNTYYKQMGQTADQISSYLGIIPLVFGIIGSFVGGFVSDRVAKKAEPWTRIWVLVLSQLAAAPFVFCVLFFDPPYSYYFLIPSYIFGEMWVGVCLSVVVELVPENLRTTGIGLYFFIISNIGGNMQTIVPSVQSAIKSAFNLTDLQAFRGALYIFFPGEYIIGSALFLLTLFVIKRDLQRLDQQDSNLSVTNLLYDDYKTKNSDEE